MSQVAFVKALVFRLNHHTYDAAPREMQVPCEGARPVGIEYWNPSITDGVQNGYYPTQDATLAQADTIKTIRIRNDISNDTYWLVVDSADGVEKFTDMCNACCGATPDMTTGLSYPVVTNELTIAANADGDSIYTFAVPANPFGADLLIAALSYNGGSTVGATPTAGGYATLAALVSWLNTNASVMGTWTAINSNKTVQLVAATGVTSANLDMDLEAAVFCLDLPAVAATVAVLTVEDAAGADQDITLPTLTLSEANRVAVLAELKKHLIGTTEIVVIGGTDYRIQYTGNMKPVAVKSADLTTTVVAFSSGACV